MTAKDIGTRGLAGTVRLRADSDVDEEALAYLGEKVGAALDRPGLPPVSGEVRIVRASAHHVEPPWSAGAEIRVGGDLVVVHAREASARELADRLHDRLRDMTERTANRAHETRRTATPPPWRGGPA
ncbi:hypothetical protein M2161_008772 [Streptomyces sp. SAI-133]|uniref:hypothetical protein n=1 Tax=unclassified Streptomyces TaxID=2593676 RepID=UPI0024753535|nr:hypothetical protein [Streptomyces sp. SAI-133]MDH6589666.1 hypothetical protein [Streptomyces sp. SAI-133]